MLLLLAHKKKTWMKWNWGNSYREEISSLFSKHALFFIRHGVSLDHQWPSKLFIVSYGRLEQYIYDLYEYIRLVHPPTKSVYIYIFEGRVSNVSCLAISNKESLSVRFHRGIDLPTLYVHASCLYLIRVAIAILISLLLK